MNKSDLRSSTDTTMRGAVRKAPLRWWVDKSHTPKCFLVFRGLRPLSHFSLTETQKVREKILSICESLSRFFSTQLSINEV